MPKLRQVRAIDSWVVPAKLNTVDTNCILDTGAQLSLMSRSVYEAMPRSLLRPGEGPRILRTVGNHAITTLGSIIADVVISGVHYPWEIFVSTEVEDIGCLIGMDFLLSNHCELILHTGHLVIDGKTTKMHRESASNKMARVRLDRDVKLEPKSEMTVSGYTEGVDKRFYAQYGCVEPSPTLTRLAKLNIIGGCAVVDVSARNVSVPIVNASNQVHILRKGTTIGIMKGVKSVSDEGAQYDPLGTRKNGEPAIRTVGHTECTTNTKNSGQPEYDHVAPLLTGIADDITTAERESLAATLQEFADVFSAGPEDIGLTDYVEHTIDTGTSRPLRLPPRRLRISKQASEAEEVQKMLARGVIRPSCSPWASPVVLVTKKDGTTRFCVDYRRLNDVTRKDAYPLPRIDDTLDALKGSMYFSTLDLYSGYWQVKMDSKDQEKTAFTTRQGLFEFCTMPFGLCNAPATFERLMELTLSGLTWKCCLVYLDDIIVYGRNFHEAHINLRLVLERIRKAKLKLKTSKCELFRAQVPFLGHVVSREGIFVNPAKSSAVKDWPRPRRVKDVRSFIGLASYYRRFIPGFATIAAPLTEMYRDPKNTVVDWTDKREAAFELLKSTLTSAPILAYPSRTEAFTLSTDASDDGIGAVLEQDQKQADGTTERVVIAFASKTLSRQQRRYCATNRELLAVIWAIENFRYYLLGRHFEVVTDHASLVWLRSFKNPEGMVARCYSAYPHMTST